MPMLEVHDLRVRYGHIEAVKGVDLSVDEGEIVALVGANGAGKTSMLGALLGLLPAHGDVICQGRRLGRSPASRRVRDGLVLVPEGRGVLAGMSVHENLLMGAYPRRRSGEIRADVQSVCERFPILHDRAQVAAGLLSGGEQQMLAIGRALMARPKLLMLDEPSLGLAPLLIRQVLSIVDDLRDEGLTILLVEQNVRQALQLADRAYVLETGRVTLEGPAATLLHSHRVREAFVGGQVDERPSATVPPGSRDEPLPQPDTRTE
jgi:branched-chain amino acid transport system ATP-binding protein